MSAAPGLLSRRYRRVSIAIYMMVALSAFESLSVLAATPEIAEIRNIEPHKDVISPPYHRAFSTPIEMMEFIKKLRTKSSFNIKQINKLTKKKAKISNKREKV